MLEEEELLLPDEQHDVTGRTAFRRDNVHA